MLYIFGATLLEKNVKTVLTFNSEGKLIFAVFFALSSDEDMVMTEN